MADYIGQRFGNYDILRLLGKGAFAEVYLAEHSYLEVPAAIKILRVNIEKTTQEQFQREARTIAHLQHPHIIRIIDFGIQDGTPFLVMEYSPNGTLRSVHPKGTRLPFDLIISYVKQIAVALDYAHQQHIIHRDIKPDNILLNARQEVVLSDFGLAIVQQTVEALQVHKPTGTPLYMAPEQIQRQPCAASDQYAVGVLVYEWITGKLPFQGSLYEIWSQHLYQAPPSLCQLVPQLPVAVENVVLKALAKEPQQRFASVQDFAIALEAAFLATHAPSAGEHPGQGQGTDTTIPAIEARKKQIADQRYPLNNILREEGNRQEAQSMQMLSLSSTPYSTSHRQSTISINRLRLLKKVRAFWINGVLEHSLHGASLLALGLQEQPDAIANPWQLVLQEHDTIAQTLPAGTHITEVYDHANGELLILGAPGAGKTTLLLELARDLLKRAEGDEQHPIPVVFNLSTWKAKRQRLTDWLVDELMSRYQVPRKLGKLLVKTDQILPLLDGLDEVAPRERTLCVKTINMYRQEHGMQSLVVCSRSADYLAQTTRLQLTRAVAIQPLTERQIDHYLLSGGESLTTLRVALHQDETLRELTQTPLMLSILTLTYHDVPVENLLQVKSPLERQRIVFEHYVERMLTRKGNDAPYTPQQVTYWLSWLARQLSQQSLTTFYIERLQPYWLEEPQAQRRYPRISAALIFALVALLGLSFPGGKVLTSLFSQHNMSAFWIAPFCTLLFGLISGALFGFLNGVLYPYEVERGPSRFRRFMKQTLLYITRGVLNGLLVGLLIGLPYGLSMASSQGGALNAMVQSGILMGILATIVFWIFAGLLNIKMKEIRPAESINWSWAGMGLGLVKYLLIGLFASLLVGIAAGLFAGISEWEKGVFIAFSVFLQGGWEVILIMSKPLILISGLFGVLIGGLSGTVIDERNLATPNQGIRLSARHSLFIGLASGVVGGLIASGLTQTITNVHNMNQLWPLIITYGILFGTLIGLVAGLRQGGIACIQHMTLRWLLWKEGVMPWNYGRFLDYAAERILLRKVGGGYIFVHRLLLEYFANLNTTPTASVPDDMAEGEYEDVLPVTSALLMEDNALSEDTLPDVPGTSFTPILLSQEALLPCGHQQPLNGSFCSVCGARLAN